VLRHNGRFVQTRGFCTDVFFQAALGWIRRTKDSGRPFFAYLVPNAPHDPMIAPRSYRQPFLDAGFDEDTAGRYGMIVNIDDNLGRLLNRLDAWKMRENTLLIFMTDNGQGAINGKRNGKPMRLFTAGLRAGKGTPHEGGTRVPCFWHWPGRLPEGHDIPALTAHLDLFPTLAELAGAPLPPGNQVEGRSLLPLFEQPAPLWPDRLLFTHVGRWAKGADPDASKFERCAVRNSRFRLVNNRELYDIRNDPSETTNVIDLHPEIVLDMRAAYDRWWSDTRPLMVNESAPNSPSRPFFERYARQLQETGIPEWSPPDLEEEQSHARYEREEIQQHLKHPLWNPSDQSIAGQDAQERAWQ
jgi:arylsulfatase